MPLDRSVQLEETALEQELSPDLDPFFIRFHGTPLDKADDLSEPVLEIYPGFRYEDNSSALARLSWFLPGVESRRGYPPNRILLEYLYRGQLSYPSENPFIRELKLKEEERHSTGARALFEPDDSLSWLRGNILPYCLTQTQLSARDIGVFRARFEPVLTRLIVYLHENFESRVRTPDLSHWLD